MSVDPSGRNPRHRRFAAGLAASSNAAPPNPASGAVDCAAGPALPPGLIADVEASGFFPQLVLDSVQSAIADERALHHIAQHEVTFGHDGVARHLTVLVLTDTRLIVSHTDEGNDPAIHPGMPLTAGTAITSLESIPLRQLGPIALTKVVAQPERFGAAQASVVEAWLNLSWQSVRRIDLEPASCPDPNCEADHGYTGMSTGEDIVVRMSETADGAENLAKLLAFASALQQRVR